MPLIELRRGHAPRPRAMLRLRQMKTLQKFASVHANVRNHFSRERHLFGDDPGANAVFAWMA
ncbi:MAG: hypothetical protein EON55_02465 [Alphaproteobacteria bacterium]|nr:MAG: hypothetical protein EON55_02465 [Alphaproteobacteria bacterium]